MEQQEISVLVRLLKDPSTISMGLDILDQHEEHLWDPSIKVVVKDIAMRAEWGVTPHDDMVIISKIRQKMLAMGFISMSELYGTRYY